MLEQPAEAAAAAVATATAGDALWSAMFSVFSSILDAREAEVGVAAAAAAAEGWKRDFVRRPLRSCGV